MAQSKAGVDWNGPVPATRRLSTLHYTAAFCSCLAVFGLGCLVWGLLAALAHPLLPRRVGQSIGQFGIMAGFRWLLWAMRMAGPLQVGLSVLDRLRNERGMPVACNHPTMLDAVLLISRLPRMVCITKASLGDNVFLDDFRSQPRLGDMGRAA